MIHIELYIFIILILELIQYFKNKKVLNKIKDHFLVNN